MNHKIALSELHCGVSFGFYAPCGYFDSEEARKQVEAMVETGVRWVVLIPTVMQENFSSPRQFRDFEQTPSDWELLDIIDLLHAKGIKVQLRPMLECFDGNGRLTVFLPENRERIPGKVCDRARRWFDSMKYRSIYYARLAQRAGCELYCLDSELDRIISFNEEWKQIIAAVRGVYDGPVTSCHTAHTGVIDFEKVLLDKNHWFYDLDILSLSDYIRASDKPGASVSEMMDYMLPKKQQLRRIAALYGKPILFGENGCTSCQGAAMSPSGWTSEKRYDGEEQARYLEAILRTFWEEPWWYGLYWWKWDEHIYRPEMHTDPAGDKGFTVLGKPAQDVMRRWFGRQDIGR